MEEPPHSDDSPSMDEKELRRQLGDIESSFLPDDNAATASEHHNGPLGADDTFLELGEPGSTPPLGSKTVSPLSGARRPLQTRTSQQGSSPSELSRSGMSSQYDEDENGGHASRLASTAASPSYASPSSPAAAAAGRRRHWRTESAVTTGERPASRESWKTTHENIPTTPGHGSPSHQREGSNVSTIRPLSPNTTDGSLAESEDQSTLGSLSRWNNVNMSPRSRLNKRPAFSSSRRASDMSTTSSVATRSELSAGSEDTLNADYALQTGGAMSINSQSERLLPPSLSRLPSLGSEVSSFGRGTDSVPTLSRAVSTGSVFANNDVLGGLSVVEERSSVSPPETPRALRKQIPAAPTDTVLAQHIQNIQVPDTVARDFRARNQDLLLDRRPASSGGPGTTLGLGDDRPRRSLTLKEQNSKIDKLTKENFDLKLKIHFLDQALQSRSADGVKELIDKNVQFQTDLANERKETQTLRRKVRELERKLEEQAATIEENQQRSNARDLDRDEDDPTLQAEMHEEILYLRQQLDYSENVVTTLREEVMTKELEKRKMAEHMRSMAGSRSEDTAGMKETIEMWQDLLNAETGRRESAEEENSKLRAELQALKIETSSPAFNRRRDLMSRNSLAPYAESEVAESDFANGGHDSESAATLVEQLKHENAELRKDLGAQTSMLTSRNRERERLQQEIEDLKLLQRKSDGARSVAGESIFERSVSRAHQRASSRASDHTGATAVADAERDSWDRKEGLLRDQNAELKIKYQDLERTHNQYLQYITGVENDFQEMEQELQEAAEDLQALQRERDEALQAFEEKESEYVKLEQEAVNEIDKLEKELQSSQLQNQDLQKRQQKTQAKLEHTTDGYRGLQGELRDITTSIMNLEDEKQANLRQIQTLEQQVVDTEYELTKWEEKSKDLESKNHKLDVTQESLQSEVTFLREEQEGDKIKIGELEDALAAAQQSIEDEQQRVAELEKGIFEERQQRDVLEDKSKEEVQKVLDDLNTENSKAKEDIRQLRRGLSAKEVECNNWKNRLEELEYALRHTLGYSDGNKRTFLAGIERLQRELEQTANELDRKKMDLADKDRLLRHRDGLLESTSLESRRLSDLLDKERNARKHDLELFERSSRGQATHIRTIAQQESRVLDLETAYSQDKKKMAALEHHLREQLLERNNLLLALWNRLSTLCGQDWTIKYSSVDGEAPSLTVIAQNLPSFQKNLISAVKTVEQLLSSFKRRVRSIEKDLWKDYQTIEHNLEIRMRRMDQLEQVLVETQSRMAEEAAAQPPTMGRSKLSKTSVKGTEEIGKLKSEIKVLKAELKFHRQHPSTLAAQMMNQQAHSSLADQGRRQSSSSASNRSNNSPARQIVAQLLRHHSSSVVEQSNPASTDGEPPSRQLSIPMQSAPVQPSEQRWVHRLKELERRLKAEREARLQDRRGARQRLEESRLENEGLQQMLEHERVRRQSFQEETGPGDMEHDIVGAVEEALRPTTSD